MNNALAIPEDNEFKTIEIISRRAASCGLYGGVGNEHKIFMILLSAREMGIKPMEALNGGLWNIQGKIEISARLMSSMIRRQGHSITIVEHTAKICILEGKRKDNGDTMRAQFTWDDAIKAGLSTRDVWKKFGEDMLYNRALSRLARRLFADVVGVCYVEGEIGGKCEVIESEEIKPESVPMIEHQEKSGPSEEEIDSMMISLLANFDVEEHEEVRAFLHKHCDHYKKSLYEGLMDYADPAKFLSSFKKWQQKQRKMKNDSSL